MAPDKGDGDRKDEDGKIGNDSGSAGDNNVSEKGPAGTHEDEYAELKDKFLRLAAEFDNYKKRTANDTSNAKRIGVAELMKPLLKVLDEFELTIIAVSNAKDKGLAKGIEMLYSNFADVLRSFGLEEVEADNVSDPYKHEIVLARESDSKPGTILEVVKKGYMLDDRLLRPASVIVAKERENDAGGAPDKGEKSADAEKKK